MSWLTRQTYSKMIRYSSEGEYIFIKTQAKGIHILFLKYFPPLPCYALFAIWATFHLLAFGVNLCLQIIREDYHPVNIVFQVHFSQTKLALLSTLSLFAWS